MLAGMTIEIIPFSACAAGPYAASAGQTNFPFGFPILNAEGPGCLASALGRAGAARR
jgi:hypothetical protein